MRVLIACEFSGIVREAFRRRGHDAWSCDLSPSLDNSLHHYQTDIFDIAEQLQWDLMIAHPPCTRLCNSGVKHLYINGRVCNGVDDIHWQEMIDAAKFFKRLYRVPIACVAMENPIMHRYAYQIIDAFYNQIIQPWQFGHGEVKATCLWLRNLPLLRPTNIVDGRTPRVHFESPRIIKGLTRSQRRSITLQGIADAMADQWS